MITSRSDSSGRIEIKVKALTNDYDKLELWRVKIPTKDNDDYEKLENPRADLVKNKFSGEKLDPSWNVATSFLDTPNALSISSYNRLPRV